jgi:hypothetical protein
MISARWGFPCTFKPEPDQVGHMIVHDMQLNLPGYRAVIPGRFTKTRFVAGHTIHVFLSTINSARM